MLQSRTNRENGATGHEYSLRVYGATYLMDYGPFELSGQEYRATHKGRIPEFLTAVSEGVCSSPAERILAPPTPGAIPAQRKAQAQHWREPRALALRPASQSSKGPGRAARRGPSLASPRDKPRTQR
jgi:hypothetical protein